MKRQLAVPFGITCLMIGDPERDEDEARRDERVGKRVSHMPVEKLS